jgi:hypothetical protein
MNSSCVFFQNDSKNYRRTGGDLPVDEIKVERGAKKKVKNNKPTIKVGITAGGRGKEAAWDPVCWQLHMEQLSWGSKGL